MNFKPRISVLGYLTLFFVVTSRVAPASETENHESTFSAGGEQTSEESPSVEETLETGSPKSLNDALDENRWSFSGHFAVSNSTVQPGGPKTDGVLVEEGIVGEVGVTASYQYSEKISGTFQGCYGCHGVEIENAYGELNLSDALRFKAGRFTIPFGAASQRVSSAVQETVSKPLPYMMGNMVRQSEFNLSVIPAPAVDNGAEVSGGVEVFEGAQLRYHGYVVRGFKGFSPDISFIASRDFEDNNADPAGGARLAFEARSWSFGFSGLQGHYDLDSKRLYQIGGFDLTFRLDEVRVRAEVAARRTEFQSVTGREDAFYKRSYWLQVDFPVFEGFRVVVSGDRLTVDGINLSAGGPTTSLAASVTDEHNRVQRATLGFVYDYDGSALFKIEAERWDFSDFEQVWVFQAGVVWLF
ncbi:MAG: hypothetical protein NUW37_10370 [Planctomycetes bacterium]|nr:hypothetical protein [Planctomycetota bacterium]